MTSPIPIATSDGIRCRALQPSSDQDGVELDFTPRTKLRESNRLLGPSRSLDDVFRVAPTLSLKEKGLLDKPSAPLLVINGKLDDQAPIADSYLLLEHGSPKEARIYPQGGHMGAQAGVNPDGIATVIIDWLKMRLSQ